MLTKSKPSLREQRIIALKNRQKNPRYIVSNPVVSKTTTDAKSINIPNPINNEKVIIEDFSAPMWLKGMVFLQKTSLISCLVMVGSMLTVYGMTVYAPQIWTKEFNRLKQLQKDERQIISTNEVVKQQLVDQSGKNGNGLVNPNPLKPPIFLEATPAHPLVLKENDEKSTLKLPEVLAPISY